jgi:starch synthase
MKKSNAKIAQVCIGKFHHFNIARELARQDRLAAILTGYPRFKLKGENLPAEKVLTSPWLNTCYLALVRSGAGQSAMGRLMHGWALRALDSTASRRFFAESCLFALSGCALKTGAIVQRRGGVYCCDRGSTHILYQKRSLEEEYHRWGLAFREMSGSVMRRELAEYEIADAITVPSRFCRRTFIEFGVPEKKIHVIPYGVPTSDFFPVGQPPQNIFRVLFVGQISLRKGIPHLIEAFQRLQHPRKELLMVGRIGPEMKTLLSNLNLSNVLILGHQSRDAVREWMSTSHVLVLPSIEEGLAIVQGQALACGCPLVITEATGGEELIEDGREGFIVPVRSSEALFTALKRMADDPGERDRMARAALETSQRIGGWRSYTDKLIRLFEQLSHGRRADLTVA